MVRGNRKVKNRNQVAFFSFEKCVDKQFAVQNTVEQKVPAMASACQMPYVAGYEKSLWVSHVFVSNELQFELLRRRCARTLPFKLGDRCDTSESCTSGMSDFNEIWWSVSHGSRTYSEGKIRQRPICKRKMPYTGGRVILCGPGAECDCVWKAPRDGRIFERNIS